MSRPALAVMAAFLLLYIAPLGLRPMVSPDEPRYAELPREMLASGDWVVPRLNGLRYFEKPVLGYWLGAASIAAFGQNAFAVRLPNALATGIAALALFLLARSFAPAGAPRWLPLATAGVFLSCMQVFALAAFCVLDALFSALITVAMALFFWAWHAEGARRRVLYLAGFGLFCGLAFLTKGFVAFAVAGAVIVPFALWERRALRLVTFPWIPLLAVVAVALPWGVAIHRREPDFWNYFFWIEHVSRFFSPLGKAQHPEPFWWYAPVLLLGALPWTFLMPAAISGLRRQQVLATSLGRYAVCWLVMPFLFFSASSGKIGTYIHPCFAPLALMLAMGLESYLTHDTHRRLFRAGAWVSAWIAAAAFSVLMADRAGALPSLRLFGANEGPGFVLTAGALAAWAGLSLWASGRRVAPAAAMTAMALVLVGVMVVFQAAAPARTMKRRSPVDLLSRHPLPFPDTPILSDVDSLTTACWVYRRTDILMVGQPGELEYGSTYPDAAGRRMELPAIHRLIQRRPDTVLVTDTDSFERLRPHLPPTTVPDVDGHYVFVQFTGGSNESAAPDRP